MPIKRKIIECEKCGGYIELVSGGRRIRCPWCGRRISIRRCKEIKDFKVPEKAIEVLLNYFTKEEINEIIPQGRRE